MSRLRGYHLMQLAGTGKPLIDVSLGHSHGFSIAPFKLNGNVGSIADFEALPLPYETIDTAILHHALEFSANPHQVLNEAARVIAPGGHIVLVVFNPYSCFGLIKAMARFFSCNPVWRANNLRYGRLMDWLKLLGFQHTDTAHGCHQLPFSWQGWLKKTAVLRRLDKRNACPGGNYYVIIARKQVAPLTPTGKPFWRSLGAPLVPSMKVSPIKKTVCEKKCE